MLEDQTLPDYVRVIGPFHYGDHIPDWNRILFLQFGKLVLLSICSLENRVQNFLFFPVGCCLDVVGRPLVTGDHNIQLFQ